MPWGIQHEHVGRNFYYVFVPSVTLLVYSSIIHVVSQQVDVSFKLMEFIRSLLCSDDIVKIYVATCLAFDSAYLSCNWDSNGCRHLQDGT